MFADGNGNWETKTRKEESEGEKRHFNLLIHSKQHIAVCSLSLHLGSPENHKTLEQKFIFQIGILNLPGINGRFPFNWFILVSRDHIPTNSVAPLSVLYINPHTTHNSSNRSGGGKLLTGDIVSSVALRWIILANHFKPLSAHEKHYLLKRFILILMYVDICIFVWFYEFSNWHELIFFVFSKTDEVPWRRLFHLNLFRLISLPRFTS